MSQEPPQQQAARVNVTDEWLRFRTLVLQERSSIAARLGELVRADLERTPAPAPTSSTPARSGSSSPRRPIRLAEASMVTDNPTWRPR